MFQVYAEFCIWYRLINVNPVESLSCSLVAIEEFVNDDGAPKLLVANPHPFHKKKEVKYFCNKIGTTI